MSGQRILFIILCEIIVWITAMSCSSQDLEATSISYENLLRKSPKNFLAIDSTDSINKIKLPSLFVFAQQHGPFIGRMKPNLLCQAMIDPRLPTKLF